MANIDHFPLLPIPIPSLDTVLPISTPPRCSAFQILKSGSHNRSNLHLPGNNFIVELWSYCVFHIWESDGDDGRLDFKCKTTRTPLPTLIKSFCQMRPAGYSSSGAASSRTHETNLAVFLLRTFPHFSPLQRGLRFGVITSYPNTSSHRSGLITLICSNSYPLLADSILLRHIHICHFI